jgi:hypothetical protein
MLRRDFLVYALGLTVAPQITVQPVVLGHSDDCYDSPALGCPNCGEVRFSHLEFLDALTIQCVTCWHCFDSDEWAK